MTFGVGEENDVRAVDIRQSEDGIRFTAVAGAHRIPIALPLTGLHHVPDALAAVAVGVVFALRAHRHGRSGGCCGDCTRCRRTGCDKEKR